MFLMYFIVYPNESFHSQESDTAILSQYIFRLV